jgi:hypothetical protein
MLLSLAIVPAFSQILLGISGYDPRYIAIDGNIGLPNPPGTIDWLDKQLDGSLKGFQDLFGNNDQSIFSPGSVFSSGSVLPKQDITNVYISNNSEYMYFVEERRANNGSSSYHLFMTKLLPTVVFGQNVVYHLSNGDIEIQTCFPSGSNPSDSQITVRQVSGLSSVLNVNAANIWSSGAFKPVPSSVIGGFAINTSPTAALVGARDSKGILTTTYDTACFAEAAISLFLLGIDPCGSQAYATIITRSSCSLTSDIKDFAGPWGYSFGGPISSDPSFSVDCANLGSFSIEVGGGTAPYLVQWFDNDVLFFEEALTGSGTSSPTKTLTAGVHNVKVVATDLSGCTVNKSTGNFTVDPVLTLSDITKSVDCDKLASLSATVSGGKGPYKFEWSDSGTTIRTVTLSSTPPITDSFTKTLTPGTHNIKLKVTDANGCVLEKVTGDITVDPILTLSDITKSVDCDNLASLSATVSGGKGPYKFECSDNGVAIRTVTLSSAPPVTDSFTKTLAPGSHNIKLTVTDANGCIVNKETGSFSVYELLSVSLDGVANCSGSVTWTATPGGGNGSNVFVWKVDGKVVGGNTTTFVYVPKVDCAAHEVCVEVTDSRGCVETVCKTITQSTETTIK